MSSRATSTSGRPPSGDQAHRFELELHTEATTIPCHSAPPPQYWGVRRCPSNCGIIQSLSVPVKNQGSHVSQSGFAVNLDNGAITNNPTGASDLVWDPVSGLTTHSGAGLRVTGTSYNSISPVQVSRMNLTGTAIGLTQIPLSFPASFFFMPSDYVVFGMRTSEGRYAKVRAQRSITDGGALRLDWMTWDTPTPRLDIASRWSIFERGEVHEYITPDCKYCTSSPVRWLGVFEAWPALTAFPIDYQWCLCGQILQEGTGVVNSSDGPLTYVLEGRRLTVESELGNDISCELCVSAIDARGLELFTCIQLEKPGVDVQCKACVPRRWIDVQMIPAPVELTGWRPLVRAVPGQVAAPIEQ